MPKVVKSRKSVKSDNLQIITKPQASSNSHPTTTPHLATSYNQYSKPRSKYEEYGPEWDTLPFVPFPIELLPRTAQSGKALREDELSLVMKWLHDNKDHVKLSTHQRKSGEGVQLVL